MSLQSRLDKLLAAATRAHAPVEPPWVRIIAHDADDDIEALKARTLAELGLTEPVGWIIRAILPAPFYTPDPPRDYRVMLTGIDVPLADAAEPRKRDERPEPVIYPPGYAGVI